MSGKATTIYYLQTYGRRIVLTLSLLVFGVSGSFGQSDSTLSEILETSRPLELARVLDKSEISYQDLSTIFPGLQNNLSASTQDSLTLGEFSLLLQELDPELRVSLGSKLFSTPGLAFRDLVFLEVAEAFWDYKSPLTGGRLVEMLGRYTLGKTGADQ